ncbi:Cytidylyltransferase family [Musa troglodytarum]|uniref:Cytidylyltransferase family n=1 Tax=Musa troglodytarum TaxID=320322 RepID=A0A9E7I8R0_9LILI|nr:Cytidylyltransferase family [Musa troglodytarum]
MYTEVSLLCHASPIRSSGHLGRRSFPSVFGTPPLFPPGFRSSCFPHHRLLATMAHPISLESSVIHDLGAAALTSATALGLLRFWEELAKRGVFEQKLNRKLVHISIGLIFLLFWPLFSSGSQAPLLAALAPGINIIRMLLLGSGIWKNDAMVKSISRHGDYRELLKGPVYYACTITFATLLFWRTSPIAIATICNLCAGDGVADIVGRQFGRKKLFYNHNKSFAGTCITTTLLGSSKKAGE